MAKTAVMVRLSETELSALDALALRTGISRATCATSILRQRLAVTMNVSEPPIVKAWGQKQATVQLPADQCAHPYRDNHNVCRVCGDQR
jgi:rRNA maturation endonuclease Nob1